MSTKLHMTTRQQKIWLAVFAGIIILIGVLIPVIYRSKELSDSKVADRCRALLYAELNPLERILAFYLDIEQDVNGGSSVTSRTFFNLSINTFYTGPLEGIRAEDC